MRVTELRKLPQEAGLAKIEWQEGNVAPHRKGEIIYLPRIPEAELFALQKGRQLLLFFDSLPGAYNSARESRAFFGGTDENPFLVEVQVGTVIEYLKNGEESFFKYIEPKKVRRLERFFGVKSRRQGDWFGVPIPLSWHQVQGMLLGAGYSEDDILLHETYDEGCSLYSTRHRLIGKCINLPGYRQLEEGIFGEGVLKAEDHSDQEFVGPHVFFQTEHLVNPQKAD